jgi:tyrosyl-tRNA synthetase
MSKVITDKKAVEEVLSRGVEIIYPKKEDLAKRMLSGERLRLYCGYDPSADSLHVGNAISINKLGQFQALGHEVIFLIGDFTGMIGDPTDKQAARQKLTREQVLENSKFYQEQASAYLRFDGDNPARVVYNSQWQDKLAFSDLIELSANFTVQQMIQRDMFQERLKNEKPIYLHEFLYPLAQGYDSVAMDIDLEIGGNDQMFNMMCGRDLQKAVNNKEKFVMTAKLLADREGKKMGKSEGNAVNLNRDAKDIYGIVMSWPDEVLPAAFELLTISPVCQGYDERLVVSREEIKEITDNLENGLVNPRDIKMDLAWKLTAIIRGTKEADEAAENFRKTFQKKDMSYVASEAEIVTLDQAGGDDCSIVDVLVRAGMAASKSEARRLIAQGGIKADGKTVSNLDHTVKITKDGLLLQRGKKQAKKIILGG